MTVLLAVLVALLWPMVLRWRAAARVLARVRPAPVRSHAVRPPSGWGRRPADPLREAAASLERLAGALRAGAPPADAFNDAARSVEGPWRAELSAVAADLAHRPDGALERWRARRPDDPAVGLVTGALALAGATGGDRAKAAAAVAATLRERAHLEAEIAVHAGQARLSAVVVTLAPLVFTALAALTDHRAARFFRSRAGLVVAAVALALDAIGAWWMVRLTRRVAAWA